MTPIASAGIETARPSLQRTALPRAAHEQVYDPALDPTARAAASVPAAAGTKADDEPFSFWDVLDLINPLQHIPGVNALYRELTGDTIKTPMKLIGSTVLGGPIGFAAAMVDSIVAETTGKDMGEHALALFKDDAAPNVAPPTQFAQAPTPAREFMPDDRGPAPPMNAAGRGEAEVIVQTAQIAAAANVFPTFKRTGAKGAAAEAGQAQAAQAAGQMRFMPIKRDGAERALTAARREAAPTGVDELKARTRFAPGAIMPGRAALAPATLAVATAAQGDHVAAQPKASAEEAHVFGRRAAAGATPAEMPPWFDQAMLDAIDKYKAMQQAR